MPAAQKTKPHYRKLIRPHRSISKRGLVILFLVYAMLMLSMSVAFSMQGAWLILPFAGIEFAAIAAVVQMVCRQRRDYELLVIDDSRVRLFRRRGGQRAYYEFQRYWAKVSLARCERRWYPSKLLISSHGREVEVGASVNEAARESLAADLKRVMQH